MAGIGNATSDHNRKDFIQKGIQFVIVSGLTSIAVLGCSEKKEEEKEVSPPEDLMQEHGLLNRILLIYDHCKFSLVNGQSFDPAILLNSAGVIRTFVEDYHEKQEEDYLFPRFKKANQLTSLVQILKQQHDAGRAITDQIIQLTKQSTRTDTEGQKLIELLTSFNTM